MNKKVFIFVLCLLIITSLEVYSEPINHTNIEFNNTGLFSLELDNVDNDSKSLSIFTSSYFKDGNKQLNYHSERFMVCVEKAGETIYESVGTASGGKLELDIDGLVDNNKITLIFKFKTYSNDLPGRYTAKYHIKEHKPNSHNNNGKGSKNFSNRGNGNNAVANGDVIVDIVDIGPWAELEGTGVDGNNLELRQKAPESKILWTNNTGLVKVKSRKPWELYVKLPESNQDINNKLINNNLKFKVTNTSNYCQLTEFLLTEENHLITAGSPTSDQWVEIPYRIQIEDFTPIEAENFTFSLEFSVEEDNAE